MRCRQTGETHAGEFTTGVAADSSTESAFASARDVDPSRGPVLNEASMAIDAAVDGQGLVLARTALAAWDLIGGRLVRPFAIAMPAPFAYWIVCPKVNARLPKIAAFTEWLLAEAAEDTRQLAKLGQPVGKRSC